MKPNYLSPLSLSSLMLVLVVLLLPLYKGGNSGVAIGLLFMSISVILCLSAFERIDLKYHWWVLIWVIFTVAFFLQIFVFAERYYLLINLPAPGLTLNAISVWGVSSSMLIISWTVSRLNFQQLKWLLWALLLSSMFQALYGYIHYSTGAISVLGLWDKQYYLSDATGTFVNRNHYAGMLAMSWPIVVTELAQKKSIFMTRIDYKYRLVFACVYSIVIFLAILASHSRMGMAAAIVGLSLCIIVMARSAPQSDQTMVRRLLFSPLAFIFFLIVFALWFGLGDIATRYAELENGNTRLDVWEAMFNLPVNAWVFGIGPGMFEDVFHLVQPSHLSVRFIYAHNDYLEFFLEFGIISASVIIVSFIYLVSRQLPKGGFGRRAGVLGALTVIVIHSIVDFNLQIPGSAVIAWIALGLLINVNMIDRVEITSANDNLSSKVRSVSHKKMVKMNSIFPRTKQEWLSLFRSN